MADDREVRLVLTTNLCEAFREANAERPCMDPTLLVHGKTFVYLNPSGFWSTLWTNSAEFMREPPATMPRRFLSNCYYSPEITEPPYQWPVDARIWELLDSRN